MSRKNTENKPVSRLLCFRLKYSLATSTAASQQQRARRIQHGFRFRRVGRKRQYLRLPAPQPVWRAEHSQEQPLLPSPYSGSSSQRLHSHLYVTWAVRQQLGLRHTWQRRPSPVRACQECGRKSEQPCPGGLWREPRGGCCSSSRVWKQFPLSTQKGAGTTTAVVRICYGRIWLSNPHLGPYTPHTQLCGHGAWPRWRQLNGSLDERCLWKTTPQMNGAAKKQTKKRLFRWTVHLKPTLQMNGASEKLLFRWNVLLKNYSSDEMFFWKTTLQMNGASEKNTLQMNCAWNQKDTTNAFAQIVKPLARRGSITVGLLSVGRRRGGEMTFS